MVEDKIVAIVQARMSSSRLPGKVLLPLCGQPVILGILQRVQQCELISDVVLATSLERSDDPLVKVVEGAGFPVVRGELSDVLARFGRVAEHYPARHYIRVTGDCPFIDPKLIHELITGIIDSEADYGSNAIEPTLPDGFDCEIFSNATLQKVLARAVDPVDREHVTHYIYTHPDEFKLYSKSYDEDFSHYRVTLDTPEDYRLITALCERQDKEYLALSIDDVVAMLQHHPELAQINSMFTRNEALQGN